MVCVLECGGDIFGQDVVTSHLKNLFPGRVKSDTEQLYFLFTAAGQITLTSLVDFTFV